MNLSHLELHELFIFNRKFTGKKEGEEHMKMLYFFPEQTPLDTQCMSMGLAEALTGFTKTFANDDKDSRISAEALLCDKRRHVFLEPEPDYWITISVNVHQDAVTHPPEDFEVVTVANSPDSSANPTITTEPEDSFNNKNASGDTLNVPQPSAQNKRFSKANQMNILQKMKEKFISSGKETISYYDEMARNKYHDSNLSFQILKELLKTTYNIFAMFCGTFESIYQQNGKNGLQAAIRDFFARYLRNLISQKLFSNSTSMEQMDVMLDNSAVNAGLNAISNNPVAAGTSAPQTQISNNSQQSGSAPPPTPSNSEQTKLGKSNSSSTVLASTNQPQNMLNVFEILDGIEYLPVNNSVFLEIQSFMNHVLSHFQHAMPENTGAMMFFFDDYLVFSGLQHNEARIIKKYMPMFLDEQSKELNMKQPDEGYLTGPREDHVAAAKKKKKILFSAPRVFIGEKKEECRIIVFRYYRISVYFFVKEAVLRDAPFYVQMRKFIEKRLEVLQKMISTHITSIDSFNETFKYIYFNHMNLAIKTSLKNKQQNLKFALNAITLVHNDLMKNKELREVYFKVKSSSSCCWVVAKFFDEREFFTIFDQKHLSLYEVNEAATKMSKIFFG